MFWLKSDIKLQLRLHLCHTCTNWRLFSPAAALESKGHHCPIMASSPVLRRLVSRLAQWVRLQTQVWGVMGPVLVSTMRRFFFFKSESETAKMKHHLNRTESSVVCMFYTRVREKTLQSAVKRPIITWDKMGWCGANSEHAQNSEILQCVCLFWDNIFKNDVNLSATHHSEGPKRGQIAQCTKERAASPKVAGSRPMTG